MEPNHLAEQSKESKETDDIAPCPPRQSMSPESKNDRHSMRIIHNCAVLIIPLDNRVTPSMVANKFVKYGKILQVRPIKKSSSCIVIFSKASEASNCIRLFLSHDKVRVTRPDQRDWNICGDSIALSDNHKRHNMTNIESAKRNAIANEKVALDNKIADYEIQQSRITIMYAQRHAYQMLIENDEIERRKRLKNNELMMSRIQTMYATSDELYMYLRRMMDLEIKHEAHIHKSVVDHGTFALHENGGSVHSAGIAIDALNKNRYSQFNDINERVFKSILLTAHKYQTKLKQKAVYFGNRIEKFNDKIDESKTHITREWNKYQNILNRSLINTQKQSVDDNTSESQIGMHHNEIDPFLSGKGYALAQMQYSAALNEYNEEMTRLFNSIIAEDKKRIDGIKTILIDYFLAQKARAMNRVKLIESSLQYIKCVDKEQDTSDFIKRFAHIASSNGVDGADGDTDKKDKESINNTAATDSSSSDIAFNFSESETFCTHSAELSRLIFSDVLKRGTIYRQGRILSRSWKPIHGDITKFGFFHAFEKKEDTKAIVSIALRNATVNILENDETNKLFTFEIVVPNASWFSLTGTPNKYIYKCNDYPQYVEWIKYLRRFAVHDDI